jgi:replication factor A1
MKITDLNADSRKVDLEAVVTEMEEPREITTRYGKTKLANAVLEDDGGSVTLVLWGDQTEKLKEGDRIRIENGFVKEWNGALQLSIGKYGKLIVL